MSRDPHLDALRIAAAPTLQRIRSERERAPVGLKKLFTVVARDLFRRALNAKYAWREAGISDHAKTAAFKELTRASLKVYIAVARIEVAVVLLLTTDLNLGTISQLVGYSYYPTFTENYLRVKKVLPSQVPRMPPKRPLIDDVTSLRAGRGDLDAEEAVGYHEQYLRIYPHVARHAQAAEAAPEPRIVVDGACTDGLIAEGLWHQIRDLPFEEQKRQVRRYVFHSTVLFDLLRKKSREEGRKSRRRGIELAELALVSLEGSDEFFGDRIHDLRALGWAWLGNAHRLARDFSVAESAFAEADRHWSEATAQRDQLVLAIICNLKGTLRMYQRDYDEAKRLLDQSCYLFRQSGDKRGEGLVLVQRAAIHGYAGRLSDSLGDLQAAASLIDERGQRDLACTVRGNLANVLARSGEHKAAAKELGRARELYREANDPLEAHKLDWIDGFIKERRADLQAAGGLYAKARAGFSNAGESTCFALISVDLMVVHSKQDAWGSVLELALEVLPILDSLRLHGETVAAVGLLAKAVSTNTLSHRLLKELRELLLQDPLARL